MKKFKIVHIFLAVIIASFAVLSSGCSDFGFNPLGRWIIESDIVIDNATNQPVEGEVINAESQTFKQYYTFEKNGTGYISVEDVRAIEFTYEYTENSVIVTTVEKKNQNNSQFDMNSVDIEYKVSNDGITMVNTVQINDSYREEITLKKV